LWDWGGQSFGPLDPRQVMRVVVPAATALVLGCQVVLSSFFLSLLAMGLRRGDTLSGRTG
jgi:hypothetical protein